MKIELYNSECLEKLKELPDNSVDAIVTDPPYFISFMNKGWDKEDSIASKKEFWAECLRVTKAGGYLLAFGHSRTHHRLFTAIEDGGWEIRDTIMWLYGSGFPKSHNIGKAIEATIKTGKSSPKALRETRMGDDYKPTGQVDYKKGRMFSSEIENDNTTQIINNDWEGWGTALKPAHEPICMARKPLEGTVAENVLKWGTGGINIDACRIGTETITINKLEEWSGFGEVKKPEYESTTSVGRFPANIILDEEAGTILDEQTDSASRFFYCPKVSSKERNKGCDKNNHPTVKPIALMEYLIKLVSKEEAIILDPFMGSGSTGIAAKKLNRAFVGIEMDEGYYTIASKRIGKDKKE